jgi:biotin carboxyl carrier protein
MQHAIKAPVGGSVWAHSVCIGQRVVAGTTLLIIEVMKTEFGMEATTDGTVTWLKACGDTVEADEIVAILEAS